MDEEELSLLQAILQGGAQSGQLDPQLENMKAQADYLHGQGKSPGMRDAGVFKVAANPLEFLSAGVNNYLGNQKQHDMMGVQQQQAGIRAQQNDRVLDALMRMKQNQQAQQPQMPGMPEMQNSDPYAQFRQGMGT